MNPFLYMLCLTLCSFFLFGCKSVNTIKPSDTLSKKAFIEDVRVVTDPFLQSRAKVLGINETLTEGGFLKIQVELENLTPRTKHGLNCARIPPANLGPRQGQYSVPSAQKQCL